MVERVVKASVTGWAPWAIGAVLSVGAAALMVFRWQREAMRTLDSYEQWWQQRDRLRANGGNGDHHSNGDHRTNGERPANGDHARQSGDARFV